MAQNGGNILLLLKKACRSPSLISQMFQALSVNQKFDAAIAELQASLDLEQGPVFRTALFRFGLQSRAAC